MLDQARQDPGLAHDASRELITFRVGEQDLCVEATKVKEMRGWSPATLLPDSPPYVRGVINLRGAILPIVDLAARLQLEQTDPTARHVVIVVWVGKRLVGLLVDAVCDILTVCDDALQPTPSVRSQTVASLIAGLVAVGDRTVGLLDLDHVLPTFEEALP